jgi:predicted nuclease of predicted toxin-antitoxin system
MSFILCRFPHPRQLEMRFLIDADMPRSMADVIRRHGHQALDVRDVGPSLALDVDIAAYARAERLCIVTGDFGFADIRVYPPGHYAGIIVLGLPRNASSRYINSLVEGLLSQVDLLAQLPGKLAIVEAGRVRLRG